jgi:hypothetical protein
MSSLKTAPAATITRTDVISSDEDVTQIVQTSLLKLTRSIDFPEKLSAEQINLIVDGALLAWLSYQHPENVELVYRQLQKGHLPEGTDEKFDILHKVTEKPDFVLSEACDAQAYIIKYTSPKTDNLGRAPTMVIVIRGTTSFTDWMCNVASYQTDFISPTGNTLAGVQVHSGFYRQFQGLIALLEDDISKHMESGGNLICVGHSLGSAVACIASLYYALKYPKRVYFLGYGSPRCGNTEFAKEFDQHVTFYARCKNGRDPVPACIPPISYSHVGTKYTLGRWIPTQTYR